MKFSEVVDALMEGKPISRTGWEDNNYMYYDKEENCFVLVLCCVETKLVVVGCAFKF